MECSRNKECSRRMHQNAADRSTISSTEEKNVHNTHRSTEFIDTQPGTTRRILRINRPVKLWLNHHCGGLSLFLRSCPVLVSPGFSSDHKEEKGARREADKQNWQAWLIEKLFICLYCSRCSVSHSVLCALCARCSGLLCARCSVLVG